MSEGQETTPPSLEYIHHTIDARECKYKIQEIEIFSGNFPQDGRRSNAGWGELPLGKGHLKDATTQLLEPADKVFMQAD
jgi:hypothetical protein